MVKTHNITGLKYLCQTSKQDPYSYSGSGIDWKIHLNKFGYHISTEILAECHTKEELNKQGRYYSKLWNIVDGQDDYGNKIWANRIPETGGGGTPSDKTKEKLRNAQLGKPKPPRNPKHTEKIASQARGKSNPKTAAGLKKWYDSNPDRNVSITKQSESLKDWYRNNLVLANNKAESTWNTRTLKDYERLSKVYQLIISGLKNSDIQSQVNIDYATIRKLRNGTHRFFGIIK
jgi:hypothetical protein